MSKEQGKTDGAVLMPELTSVQKCTKDLEVIVTDLVNEYKTVSKLYASAGLEVELKEQALQGMVHLVQLQQVAIQNYANWKHVVREDSKVE